VKNDLKQRTGGCVTITEMPTASLSPHSDVLRRLAQLDVELERARADLKNLRTHDPLTSEVVMRGAKLSQERSRLERRLELLRQDSRRVRHYPD